MVNLKLEHGPRSTPQAGFSWVELYLECQAVQNLVESSRIELEYSTPVTILAHIFLSQ